MNKFIAEIGRLIVVAIPDFDWVTVIIPMPFQGTKQITGTFDYVIETFEEAKRLREQNEKATKNESYQKEN